MMAHTPIRLALGMGGGCGRSDVHGKFQASLNYIAKPCVKGGAGLVLFFTPFLRKYMRVPSP